jgi:DNA-binding NtrC family response regulator
MTLSATERLMIRTEQGESAVNGFVPVAVVVEDDDDQRHLLGTIFEESDVQVIACDSADAAVKVMEKVGERTIFMFADVSNASRLASEVENRWPHTRVVTTDPASARTRPMGRAHTKHMQKPWRALDLIVELERAIAAR